MPETERNKEVKKLMLGAAMLAALLAPAHATVVVDQNFSNPDLAQMWSGTGSAYWGDLNGDTGSIFYQSFTVGVTGTLAGIRIYGPAINPWSPAGGPIKIQVLNGGMEMDWMGHMVDGVMMAGYFINGLPISDAPVVGTSMIQPSAIPQGWSWEPGAYADFSNDGIHVTSGEQLTFTVESLSYYSNVGSCVDVGCGGPLYSGGLTLHSSGYYPGSMLFTTYVNNGISVGSAPEPSTWAMMLLGFAGLGFAGYRASRKGAAFPV